LAQFKELQQVLRHSVPSLRLLISIPCKAYAVLSDESERQWYDLHKDEILGRSTATSSCDDLAEKEQKVPRISFSIASLTVSCPDQPVAILLDVLLQRIYGRGRGLLSRIRSPLPRYHLGR
jgi:hypothetical protein